MAHSHEHDPSKRGLTGSYHQRTYGTVKEDLSHSHSPKRDSKVIIHEVKPTETLQGIALKYDVTVDQIRRLNKLGYSESIQTRAVLEVPCNGDGDGPNGKLKTKDREEASKGNPTDYLERSAQSVLNSADEELEQAKKFVAKLAQRLPATTIPAVAVPPAPTAAPAPQGYNRPTEESPRPDPRSRVTKPSADSEAKRDKLENTMFEL